MQIQDSTTNLCSSGFHPRSPASSTTCYHTLCNLHPADRTELFDSTVGFGITAETLCCSGVRAINADDVAYLTNLHRDGLGGGYLQPYPILRVDGDKTRAVLDGDSYSAIWLREPVTPPRRKVPTRCLQPWHVPPRLFIPAMPPFSEGEWPPLLCLVVDERDAIRATEAGLPTIALPRMKEWMKRRSRNATDALIENLDKIPLAEKDVVLVVNSDVDEESEDFEAFVQFVEVLREVDVASVRLLQLPARHEPLRDGVATGLAGYLNSIGTVQDFLALVEQEERFVRRRLRSMTDEEIEELDHRWDNQVLTDAEFEAHQRCRRGRKYTGRGREVHSFPLPCDEWSHRPCHDYNEGEKWDVITRHVTGDLWYAHVQVLDAREQASVRRAVTERRGEHKKKTGEKVAGYLFKIGPGYDEAGLHYFLTADVSATRSHAGEPHGFDCLPRPQGLERMRWLIKQPELQEVRSFGYPAIPKLRMNGAAGDSLVILSPKIRRDTEEVFERLVKAKTGSSPMKVGRYDYILPDGVNGEEGFGWFKVAYEVGVQRNRAQYIGW